MTQKEECEAVHGVNYVPDGKSDEVRREPGDRFVNDLPKSALWLIKDGDIRVIGMEDADGEVR